MSKRILSDQETLFVTEAERGYFAVDFDGDGSPYAMGAEKTGNLFSMEVIEIEDPMNNGSIYVLPPQTRDEHCEHGTRIGNFCCGCEQQRMG